MLSRESPGWSFWGKCDARGNLNFLLFFSGELWSSDLLPAPLTSYLLNSILMRQHQQFGHMKLYNFQTTKSQEPKTFFVSCPHVFVYVQKERHLKERHTKWFTSVRNFTKFFKKRIFSIKIILKNILSTKIWITSNEFLELKLAFKNYSTLYKSLFFKVHNLRFCMLLPVIRILRNLFWTECLHHVKSWNYKFLSQIVAPDKIFLDCYYWFCESPCRFWEYCAL